MAGTERVAGDREGKGWRVAGTERVAGDREGKGWRVAGKERVAGYLRIFHQIVTTLSTFKRKTEQLQYQHFYLK